MRESYRRFMGRWPELYDYRLAQVPSPLTEEMEREKREKVCVCVCAFFLVGSYETCRSAFAFVHSLFSLYGILCEEPPCLCVGI